MNTRVPVVNPDGSPAMPTLCSRARRWVRDGKAVGKWNDLGVYYVQLLVTPSDTKTQTIVCGCDPGKSYSGFGVQSSFTTLFRTHAILPFQRLTSSRRQSRGILPPHDDIFLFLQLLTRLLLPPVPARSPTTDILSKDRICPTADNPLFRITSLATTSRLLVYPQLSQ